MCGICGVVETDGWADDRAARARVQAMAGVLRHRGPDDSGFHVEPGIALGARRLAIVDVEGGHQPVENEDGSVVAVQNGELYNHDVLRRELRGAGHVVTTRCDTAVLPHLYERDGIDFPRALRGIFAVAVWDARRRRCVLARDHVGVKPLYYARSGSSVVFASELKAVLASGLIDPDVDVEAVDAFLTLGFVPGPRTMLRGVAKVPPGCVVVIEDGEARVERYWSFPRPHPTAGDRRVNGEQLLAALDEAVRSQLMSDVPLGAMLSGGIDSSLVVALMARHASGRVKTFSVGFSGESGANELAEARAVAREFGTDHHELELSPADEIDLEELVWHLDEPVADLSALGFSALSELASQSVKVALSGQGADELLAGYARYRTAALVARWARAPSVLREGAARLPSRRLRRLAELAALSPVERLVQARSLPAAVSLSPLRGEVARAAVRGRLEGLEDAAGGSGGAAAAALHLDARLGLVDDMLHYFDRMSMAHSLEVRVPFLDLPFVELCATIPIEQKLVGGVTKAVLREAAATVLPRDVLRRPKVGFFNPAVDAWIRSAAGRAATSRLAEGSPRVLELVDEDALASLVREPHRNPRLLLAVVVLELWLSSFLPRALRRASHSAVVPA